MAGHRPFEALRGAMSSAARSDIEAKALALRADVLLSELLARKTSQEPGDDANQATIAADEMPVAALRRLVRSFGGELEVAVALPDGRRVPLTGVASD